MNLTIRWSALLAALKSAWPVWLGVAGVAVAVCAGSVVAASLSETIRYAGTILQVLGLATVAIGLSDLRRLFGRPSLPHRIWSWLRQLAAAFVPPKPISVQASDICSASVVGEARVVRGAGPGASLETRVSIVEENLNLLRDELDAKEHKFRQEVAMLKAAIHHMSEARRAENQETARKVGKVAVGGLQLEFVGLLWLILGILGTSVPDELARLIYVTL